MKRDGAYWFDDAAAERAVEFFPRYLRHIDGPMRGDRVELMPWQETEIIRPLFGWKRPHTCGDITRHNEMSCEYGRRRYTELELFIPRKNVKTTICMGIALILLAADDEGGAQIYLAAYDQDQAGLGFNIAASFVDMSPALKRQIKLRRSKYRMWYPPLDSIMWAIPSSALGALGAGAHGVVYDEYETAANDDLDEALASSQGARRQPIMVRAGTAGNTIASPMGRLYQRMRDTIDGVRAQRDDELIVLHEAAAGADWRDVRTWIAANPGYGMSLQPSFVTKQIRKAEEEPVKRADILRFGLNMWPDLSSTWMPLETWDASAGQIVTDADLRDRTCYVGVGISSSRDLAAIALVFPPADDDPTYRVRMRHFLPAATYRARAKSADAPPYEEWINAGALTLFDTPDHDEVLDYDELRAIIGRYAAMFNVDEVVCNPRGAMTFMVDLGNTGQTVVEMPPTYKSMSPALNELERLVGIPDGITHGGDPALRWQMRHLKIRTGPNGEIMPNREATRTSIEGVVALLSAMNRAIVAAGVAEPERWTAS